jgi:hypothetical protein
MGCSCRTFRKEPLARPCSGGVLVLANPHAAARRDNTMNNRARTFPGKVGNPTYGPRVRSAREEEMWLALAAMTLAAAIGVSVLALAIQFER